MGRWVDPMLGEPRGGLQLHPSVLLELVLPPLAYHVGVYILDLLLVCAAGAYFLYGRGIRRYPLYAGSLALGFMGYFFTLIAAGHRGMFNMMPYAIFVFGFLDRAVGRRSLLHFALAGTAVGLGLTSQPDVMGLFVLMAAAYGAYRGVVELLRAEDKARFALMTAAGVVLSGLFFVLMTLGFFRTLTDLVLVTREEVRGKTPEQQWEFATNWSMPPEEILEFVAPCVYGTETGNVKAPYWGRMGQTRGWEQHRQGLMNLRQHTVYIGALPLVFALYAIAAGLFRRRRGPPSAEDALSEEARIAIPHHEIAFWLVAVVVTFLLALGRYFPLYRLFYAIPQASKIRCPVKFMHLAGFGVSVLFAMGLALFFADLDRVVEVKQDGKRKQGGFCVVRPASRLFLALVLVAGLCALALFVGSGVASLNRGSLMEQWQTMGLAPYADVMMRTMTGALRHGGFLFLVACALFACARFLRNGAKVAAVAGPAVLVVVALDVASVAKRYVHVRDLAPYYASHVVADAIKREPQPTRVSFWLSPRTKLDPLSRNFMYHVIDVLEPWQYQRVPGEYRELFTAFQRNILKLWQFTSTRFVVGPLDRCRQLVDHPAFEDVLRFNVVNHRIVPVAPGSPGTHVLVRNRSCLPRAVVYYAWDTVPEDEVLKRMTDPAWNPVRSAVLAEGTLESAQSERSISPASVALYETLRVRVEVEAASDGLLVLNDKYDPDWKVRVDGKRAELIRANYLMRAVKVPAGRHTVEFTYRPNVPYLVMNLTAYLSLGAWAAVVAARKRKAETA